MKAMQKRIFVLLAAALLLACMLGMTALAAQTDPADEPVCYEHGDVNSDGSITGDDAIYLLFASFGDLFGDEYLLSQDGDLDGDGVVTGEDAIYLLFASFGDMFGDQYPLNGTIHNYFDPIWTWDTEGTEPTASVSLKCACGQPHTITEGITVTAGTVTEPTCVASGSKEYTGKVSYDGKDYENTLTVTLPALGENGHDIQGEPTCTEGAKCANCDYTEPALGHSYVANGEKVEGCKHTLMQKCACGAELEGESYYTHSYTPISLVEATCSADGEQISKCACGDEQKDTIPANEAFHEWNEGVKEGGVTTYTCKHNASHTKTVVEMSSEGVSAQALKENEVQLDGGASISLGDNTLGDVAEDAAVVIEVNEVSKNDLALDAAQLEQIGNATVYDFSMTVGGQQVTEFGGKVTVSLPYTLQDGDDVNNIDVWFIDDSGNITSCLGVYNNGYVIFETEHFSYYTVTRMTPAERCERYGHNMVERTKAANCTEDGYHKIFCLRCGMEEKNEVKEMLGHDYQKDAEQSVDATCDAPGKLVSICANCDHKRIQEVKQLTHDWAVETVAPTCSAKGYDKYSCKLCQAEKALNEKEALGHKYPEASAQWTWSDDRSKASVTLVCENDQTHTKVLTAVVTSKGGNACVGGTVSYSATASYNKVSYTATETGEQAGTGHTPDTAWGSDNDKHYHTCTVCGEKVGSADHDWERTVTKAATCAKDGSATDTCSVCGKEKAVVLPATGKHSFVNSVCTACGYKEGSCDHKTLIETKYDLADYGACDGYITVRACACGQKTVWTGSSFGCDFEDTSNVDEENYYAEYASTCKVCGLKGVGVQYRVIDEENCTGYYVIERKFTMGTTVIVDGKEESETYNHPVVVKHDPVNLADYGLCAMTVTQTSCSCGLNVRLSTEGEGCDMSYDEDSDTYTCSVCGATGKSTAVTKKGNCLSIEEATVTFYKNGTQVVSFVERYVETDHAYEMVDYEMAGETCEDGVSVNWVCTVCGETEEDYMYGCSAFLVEKTIDTSATDSCSTAIQIRTCPCGSNKYWRYVFDGEAEDHEWIYDYDPETGIWLEYCEVCGFTIDNERSAIDESTKDENCRVTYTNSYTYANGKGQEFKWELQVWTTCHDNIYEFELFGESCEDGVKVTRNCADCGLNTSWTEDYHCYYRGEELDLSEYGFCSGGAYLYGCPCGESTYFELESYDCVWRSSAGDEGFSEEICETCGIVWQTRWEEIPSEEGCVSLCSYTYTFLKDGVALGALSYVDKEYNHRYVYALTLNEGAQTCGDGYTYVATCLGCGYTYEDWGWGCSSYEVERELIDGMCGQAELVHERCACGKYDQTSVVWYGREYCDFYSGESVYNETYGAWQYFCAGCGASRIRVSEQLPVAGETCQYEYRTTQYYFNSDGIEICRTLYSAIRNVHTWLYTYQLQGETCDDGWTYTTTCADCGVSEAYEDVNYSCDRNRMSREVVYDTEDICGPVYMYHYGCACGQYNSYSLAYDCNMQWVGKDCVCPDCGLTRQEERTREQAYGSCKVNITTTYTFLMDGEVVATATSNYQENDHEIVYELILLGETCEDGYKVINTCAYCDYEYAWDEPEYGHDLYRVEYYSLPEEACGGFASVDACACGQERSVSYNDFSCNMDQYFDYVTDENGYEHTIRTAACTVCGLTEVQEWYKAPGEEECHTVLYQDYKWSLGDWELHLTGRSVSISHDWKGVKAELKEGATTCYDGVNVTDQCIHCAEQLVWSCYWHYTVADPDETIDLAAYGAVCGAKLELLACACGEDKSYVFSDDTECDIGYNSVDHWIEGVLPSESYFTIQSWESVWSYSYERYCAVTDPQCGLKMRYALYWVNEGCEAVEYETWQLGYDPQTGTCQKEVTIATGDRKVYHAYEQVSVVEGTADGMRTQEVKYVCSDCGSYWTEFRGYDAQYGLLVKQVYKAVNVLDDGNNKEYTQTLEYVIIEDMFGDAERRNSLNRYEYVYADGSTYWYQYEYTYDIDGGCKRTRVASDSSGTYEVYEEEESHRGHQIGETLEQSTCTQTGSYSVTVICRFCEKTLSDEIREYQPTDHSWSWNSEKETYYCCICGLENTNGVSGSIWMEDLSNDTDYVVGYYDRDEIGFNPYVSLILYDVADGENDELVLDSIVVTYLTKADNGIRGLSFNKAATAEAAAAALEAAGYTGSYAVRISCVPMNGDTSLDYAITFDTLIAE